MKALVARGPHGGEQGTAMFKKCARRGLARCGLELHCYIWCRCISHDGWTRWRAAGVYGRGNSQCLFEAWLKKMAPVDMLPSQVQRE